MTSEHPASVSAPVAARTSTIRRHHGDAFDDPYEWFRAKEDEQVLAHLRAENAHTEAVTAHLEGLRSRIFDEIKGRTLETDLSVPSRRGDWWYYGRTVEGQQYGIQCRAPLASPDDWTPPQLEPGVDVPGEQVLLDGNVEAEGHEFFSLGSFDVSKDGKRMLFGVDVAGDERYTIRVRDLVTGEQLADEIPGTFSGAEFTPDGSGILYTTVDDAWRPDTLWLHAVGTDVASDVTLFHEPDEKYWLGRGHHPQRQVPGDLGRLEHHVGGPHPRHADLTAEPRAGVAPHRGRRVLRRPRGRRRRGRAAHRAQRRGAGLRARAGAAEDPQGERRVLLPHTPGQRLLDADCFRDFAVVEYRRGGLARVGLLDYRSGDGGRARPSTSRCTRRERAATRSGLRR